LCALTAPYTARGVLGRWALLSSLLSGRGQGRLQPLACPVPSAKRGRTSDWDIRMLSASRVETGRQVLDVLVSFWATPVRDRHFSILLSLLLLERSAKELRWVRNNCLFPWTVFLPLLRNSTGLP